MENPPRQNARRTRRKRRNRRRRILPRGWNSVNPPSINPNPWYPLSLELRFPGITENNHGVITIQTIYRAINTQTGVNVMDSVWWLFRFLAVAAWEVKGYSLEMTINDLDNLRGSNNTPEDYTALTTRSDIAGRNSWAHVSFIWPRDLRNNVYSNNKDSLLEVARIKTDATTTGSEVNVYIRILWRSTYENIPGRSIQPIFRNSSRFPSVQQEPVQRRVHFPPNLADPEEEMTLSEASSEEEV